MTNDTSDEAGAVKDPRDSRAAANAQAGGINRMILGAVNDAEGAGVFENLARCHNTRRMILEYAQDCPMDGSLPALNKIAAERKVFTWEGAPDNRVPYADEVIVEHCMIRDSVWHRGEVRLGPRETEDGDGSDDERKAGDWQKAVDYVLDVQKDPIGFQLGLFNSCVEEYGYGLLHSGCRRRVRTAKVTVTVQQLLVALVRQVQAEVQVDGGGLRVESLSEGGGGEGPGGVTQEMAAVIGARAQEILDGLFLEENDGRLRELLQSLDANMPDSEAGLAAKELRETRTEATYFAPQDDGYMPYVEALVPFINVIHGTDMRGDGRCWWFAIPEVMCEADVRTRAMAEQWSEEFLGAVLGQADKFLNSGQEWSGRVPQWALSGAGVGQVLATANLQEKFYQVIYVYRQLPNEDGLPMVYHTLVHAHVNDLVGFHVASGQESLPLHVECREKVLLAVQSRGVPQIVVAGQNIIKMFMDAEGARAQLASNPPLNRTSPEHKSVEPGREFYQKRTDGPGNQFLQVPAADRGAAEMMDRVRDMLDKRFFRHATTDPDMKRLYREMVALSAVGTVRALVRMIWKVMQGHVDNLRVGRLAGRAVDLNLDRDSMQGDVDVRVEFTVDSLSTDALDKMMDWVLKLSQADRGGVVDWTEFVSIMARMSNPDMARRIIMPKEAAATRIRDDQNNRISQMWSGSTMRYPERQTGVPMRIEEMDAWRQDPENLARLQSSPRFAEQMEAEYEYLNNQTVQYKENAARGRAVVPKGAGEVPGE